MGKQPVVKCWPHVGVGGGAPQNAGLTQLVTAAESEIVDWHGSLQMELRRFPMAIAPRAWSGEKQLDMIQTGPKLSRSVVNG